MESGGARIGIIGGSAFSFADNQCEFARERIDTPFGLPSSELRIGTVGGREIAILARHGEDHSILPHAINYRANLWALRQVGVDAVIALATVGGIDPACSPGTLAIPDQVLDYTYSREHTFSPLRGELFHIDFTEPYCAELRGSIIESADALGIEVRRNGTYAATQGPRFESAAEIRKYLRDGADIVGMTGMPEASLAREIGICYAAVALVVNFAAGVGGRRIEPEEIRHAQRQGMLGVNRLLAETLSRLGEFECVVPRVITP